MLLKNLFIAVSFVVVLLNLYWAQRMWASNKARNSSNKEEIDKKIKSLQSYGKYSIFIFAIFFLIFRFWGN